MTRTRRSVLLWVVGGAAAFLVFALGGWLVASATDDGDGGRRGLGELATAARGEHRSEVLEPLPPGAFVTPSTVVDPPPPDGVDTEAVVTADPADLPPGGAPPSTERAPAGGAPAASTPPATATQIAIERPSAPDTTPPPAGGADGAPTASTDSTTTTELSPSTDSTPTTESSEPAESGVGTDLEDGPEGESDAGESDAGESSDDGEPVIIDLCAEPEPIEGCPEGVGGTILMAHHLEFDILRATDTAMDRCEIEVPRGHAALTILSNQPGWFQVTMQTYVAGSYPPEVRQERRFEVGTGDAEVARYEAEHDAGRDVDVQTCLAVPAFDGTDTMYGVVVEGRPLDAEDPAWLDRWGGGYESLFAVEAGRPDVVVTTPDDRIVRVSVPYADGEGVEVHLIQREAGATTPGCDRFDPEASPGGRSVQLLREVVSARAPGAPLDGFRWKAFEGDIRVSDLHDLCVTWFRDLAPSREVVERTAIEVTPPARPNARIEVLRVTPAPGSAMTGIVLNVFDSAGTYRCYSSHDVGVFDPPRPACSLDVRGANELPELAFEVIGGEYLSWTYSLALRRAPCAEATTCVVAYRAPIGVTRAGGTPVGTVDFQVVYTNPPDRALGERWSVGSERWSDVSADGEAPSLPRLDLGGTRFEYDPSVDPFTLRLHWAADSPVIAHGSADVAASDPRAYQCDSEIALPQRRSAGTPTPATSGVIEFDVCPGTPMRFEIVLTDDRGAAYFTPDPDSTPYPSQSFYWRAGAYRTADMTLQVSYGLRARIHRSSEGFDDPTWGPSEMVHVSWWAEIIDQHTFSQDRRSGFIREEAPSCYRIDEFDLEPAEISPTPIEVVVGATMPVRAWGRVSSYATCGYFVHDARGEPLFGETTAYIRGAVPVRDLLRGGVRLRGSAPHGVCDCRANVELVAEAKAVVSGPPPGS